MPRAFVLSFVLAVAPLAAQPRAIPDAELPRPPGPARCAQVLADARRDGWAPQAGPLREAALSAYRRGDLQTADAWFRLYGWASLLGRPEAEYVRDWVRAVNEAKCGRANMPRPNLARRTPLAAALSPELQAWVLQDPAFSSEFFAVLSPVDYVPRVFEILNALYRAGPEQFKAYPSLALALAVVFDVPPPPYWPHGQVRGDVLPRKFPDPVEAFSWWVRQDRDGRTFRSLRHERADELKFVVDTLAAFPELEWSQASLPLSRSDLARAYFMIRYRTDRIDADQLNWTGGTYRLQDVLKEGGICADQAYFATQVVKARGIPTLFFAGEGNDGRHAWFGYLDASGQWNLNAGRYSEQRYVTGYALDPQTWQQLTDHELQFLQEHFHALPSYRQSRIHEEFALNLLAGGDAAAAASAARRAVQFEPRNQDGWETLIAATSRLQPDPAAAEAVLREAALAFRRYPDLEVLYVVRLAESLRARGQLSEAEMELKRIAQKNRLVRVDISVQQAKTLLLRSIESEPLVQQIRTYDSLVDTYGRGAGIAFVDEVVATFIDHLLDLDHRSEARAALGRARRTLAADPKSQLELELNRLEQKIAGR